MELIFLILFEQLKNLSVMHNIMSFLLGNNLKAPRLPVFYHLPSISPFTTCNLGP